MPQPIRLARRRVRNRLAYLLADRDDLVDLPTIVAAVALVAIWGELGDVLKRADAAIRSDLADRVASRRVPAGDLVLVARVLVVLGEELDNARTQAAAGQSVDVDRD